MVLCDQAIFFIHRSLDFAPSTEPQQDVELEVGSFMKLASTNTQYSGIEDFRCDNVLIKKNEIKPDSQKDSRDAVPSAVAGSPPLEVLDTDIDNSDLDTMQPNTHGKIAHEFQTK